jgi:hypothetical protein
MATIWASRGEPPGMAIMAEDSRVLADAILKELEK